MLTPKLLKLLIFLNNHINYYGYAPSFDKMREHMQIKSKSGIHSMLVSLEERGIIRRIKGKSRAIEIANMPNIDNYLTPDMLKEIEPETWQNEQEKRSAGHPVCSIPFLGSIAAGTPIDIFSYSKEFIDVPTAMLKNNKKYYALKVSGDSMKNIGILNDDMVIIEQTQVAKNGDIVVALVHKSTATLKRFYQNADKVYLEAENENYERQVFNEEAVEIQGKLANLYRSY